MSSASSSSTPATDARPSRLAEIVTPPSRGPLHRHRGKLIAAAVLLLGAGAFLWSRARATDTQAPAFVTTPLTRGDIGLTITATGKLAPTNEVIVGSELSGTVLEVYVDINDRVTKGQPLAKLDTTKLAQQIESSRANLRAAQASVAQAEATVRETAATLKRLQELRRVSEGKLPSQTEFDAATAAADRAAANLLAAQASVAQAEATLRINENDLSKAVIKSPIDGIVLTRAVEPGQTVAASFTAPELFVIAENLDHMKLTVTVAEADIGRLAAGQSATFTVDAWPDRTYRAKVRRVAFGSSVTNNVVTYETDLEVSNADLSLRPGMTATADIRVAESKNVFLVPAAALRFDPEKASAPVAEAPKKTFVQSLTPMPRMNRPRAPGGNGERDGARQTRSKIWILRDGVPRSIPVKLGLNDGRQVEISGDDLVENLPVITKAAAPSAK
jgi:RND family efflux transporter, MFP subunit